MMTIDNYKQAISENKFREYPSRNDGTELLSRFLKFEDLDNDLLIYLNTLILCRSFYGTYTAYFGDVKWFLEGFFKNQEKDLVKPHLTGTIKVAADMILNGDTFTHSIIGTTFMFGVIEFYAKSKLGFNPMDFDFFNRKGKQQYIKNLNVRNKNVDLTIKSAFEQLKVSDLPIAMALDEIDDFTTTGLLNAGIPSYRWHVHTVADRLHLARNPMLHGESHSFYSIGSYLLMLYTLLHLYDRRELMLTEK